MYTSAWYFYENLDIIRGIFYAYFWHNVANVGVAQFLHLMLMLIAVLEEM